MTIQDDEEINNAMKWFWGNPMSLLYYKFTLTRLQILIQKLLLVVQLQKWNTLTNLHKLL